MVGACSTDIMCMLRYTRARLEPTATLSGSRCSQPSRCTIDLFAHVNGDKWQHAILGKVCKVHAACKRTIRAFAQCVAQSGNKCRRSGRRGRPLQHGQP